MLYARVANSQVDMARLREQFESVVKSINPVPCRDSRVDDLGWAITCRDGSVDDGVRRISADNGARKVVYGKGNRREAIRSQICMGICPRGWDALEALVNGPYGARYMQLESEGEEMPFHTDAMRETWCLHIPLVTNPDALLQWQFPDG